MQCPYCGNPMRLMRLGPDEWYGCSSCGARLIPPVPQADIVAFDELMEVMLAGLEVDARDHCSDAALKRGAWERVERGWRALLNGVGIDYDSAPVWVALIRETYLTGYREGKRVRAMPEWKVAP